MRGWRNIGYAKEMEKGRREDREEMGEGEGKGREREKDEARDKSRKSVRTDREK